MVAALQKKLWRDLRGLAGQVATIGGVVACGIGGYVAMRGSLSAIEDAQEHHAARYRLADAWVDVVRAPDSVAAQLESVAGVERVVTRVVQRVTLPLEGLVEPAYATVVSLPPHGVPPLNALQLVRGRLPDPRATDEVATMEQFMLAHGLELGARVPAIINGTLRRLQVVGIAFSPEFIYPVPEGELLPDDRRFAVLWMPRDALARAFQMEGAFNNAVFRLQPGAAPSSALARIDSVLEPWGGRGAYPRERQMSWRILEQEKMQLEAIATLMPAIFLGVAAFILAFVLNRLVTLQRVQVATLKAIGYSNAAVALHFLQLAGVVVLVGTAGGIAGGTWLGRATVQMYRDYFYFPSLRFVLQPDALGVAVLVSLLAALAGALGAVRSVTALSPAEAMQPPAPATFRSGLMDRAGWRRLVAPAMRMSIREMARHPVKLLLSSLGIALAAAVLVATRCSIDSIEFLMDLQFYRSQREDVLVALRNPVPWRELHAVARLPGVLRAEGMRVVPARLHHGAVAREIVINGYAHGQTLRVVRDRRGNRAPIPDDGIMLTRKLAEIVGVTVGGVARAEFLDGSGRTVDLPVVAVVDETLGLQGHMSLDALHRALRQERHTNSLLLQTDPRAWDGLQRALAAMPATGAITRRNVVIEVFRQEMTGPVMAGVVILTVFALILACAVVYNNARVALSQRAHQLATLRVLGFTRREIAGMLTTEIMVHLALGIPAGLALGTLISHVVLSRVDPELFRLTVVISPATYAFATVVALLAGALGIGAVRQRLHGLDLLAVLKARE
ncbi:MAG: ABC transporter permease [Deltaproteobacteria bacterium]|nr:ABC transporter permease [Deltaproteobacteria bacterium]